MCLYKGMDAATLEAEYNLTARRGMEDFTRLVERWIKRNVLHREASGAQADIAYGEGEREKLDIFSCGDSASPLLVFIHGGYWQRGDKSMYSFVTEAFIQHGVSVAMLNYNLTPSVRIGQIPPQIKKAIAWLFNHASDIGFARDKLSVMGHSAGGHLTAMMMATDWPGFDSRLPADLICSGIPVSGVFELEPLVHTTLNNGPQMDIAEAIEESPIFIPPVTDAPQLVVVGGGETSEFIRQSDDYAAKFRTAQRSMERYDVPADDHFDELERLAEEDSDFFQKSMQLITA